VGGEVLTRPYSIASDPESPDEIELLLDLVPTNRGSQHLFSLRPGATVRYTGPWGTFSLEEAPQVEAVFVAIGTGIAPVRPMVRRALATAVRPIVLLYATSPAGAPYLDELVRPHPSYTALRLDTGDVVGQVRHRFVDADADRSRQFFVCGVGDVVHTLRDLLRGAGYERRAVRYEKW
jgi:ferredoxin-NADP reductase